jgi:hypothetical protein
MDIVTASVDGTTTSLTDINTLWLPRNEYKGQTIYFTGGTVDNLGQSRKIVSSNPTTSQVQWSLPLPVMNFSGDEAELWCKLGYGWEPTAINRMIEMAHREAQEYLPVAYTSEPIPWDSDNPVITLVAAIQEVNAIEYQTSDDGDWGEVLPAPRRSSSGWWLDNSSRTVRIDGAARGYMSGGGNVRLHARVRESPLTTDSDITLVNAEYLVARVCEMAYGSKVISHPDPGLVRDRMLYFQRDAQVKRTMASPRRGTTSKRVAN